MTRMRLGLMLVLLACAALLPWAGWEEGDLATSRALAQGAAVAPSSTGITQEPTLPPARSRPSNGPANVLIESAEGIFVGGSAEYTVGAISFDGGPHWMNPKSYLGLIDGGSDIDQFPTEQLKADVDRWLDVRTRDLARKLAAVVDDSTKAAEAKEELAKAIRAHFNVRHEVRQREVKALEERIAKLREHLDKRAESRDAIVSGRLQRFVTTAEGLGWDEMPKSGRYPGSINSGGYNPPAAPPYRPPTSATAPRTYPPPTFPNPTGNSPQQAVDASTGSGFQPTGTPSAAGFAPLTLPTSRNSAHASTGSAETGSEDSSSDTESGDDDGT